MPVFMYRKGEAKIFASLSEVPPNEGWQDMPPADMVVGADGSITFGEKPVSVEPVAEPRIPETSEDLNNLLQASVDTDPDAVADEDPDTEAPVDGEPVNYLQPPKKRGRPKKVTDEPNS